MGYRTPQHTALDELQSILNKDAEGQEQFFLKEDEVASDEDMADLVFRKAIFPGPTGDFDKDFPSSPKVAKGGKGQFKKSLEKVCNEGLPQTSSVPQGDSYCISKPNSTQIDYNECVIGTESDSISSSPGRLSDLDIHGNIHPSGRMCTSASNKIHKNATPITEDSMPLTDAGNITYRQLFLQ